MACNDFTRAVIFFRMIGRSASHQLHKRVIENPGMNPELAVVFQGQQHRLRTVAQPHLERRSILNELRGIAANLQVTLIKHTSNGFRQLGLVLDEVIDLAGRHLSVSTGARHPRIDLCNDDSGVAQSRLHHIHANSERVVAVFIGRTHLDQGHIQGHLAIAEQQRHVRHGARGVIRLTPLHRISQRRS